MGRPHVARALVEAGYVTSIPEAFDLYIGRNGPAYAEREKLTPMEAVETLLRYGGKPVLAHPSYIKDLHAVLPELKAAGLVGMEVYYSDYDEAMQPLLAGVAKQYGLMPLGGSDYHALDNPASVSRATFPCRPAWRRTSWKKSCRGYRRAN